MAPPPLTFSGQATPEAVISSFEVVHATLQKNMSQTARDIADITNEPSQTADNITASNIGGNNGRGPPLPEPGES